MEQLTGLDAAFLALDSPTACGHVGSMCILDPPESDVIVPFPTPTNEVPTPEVPRTTRPCFAER